MRGKVANENFLVCIITPLHVYVLASKKSRQKILAFATLIWTLNSFLEYCSADIPPRMSLHYPTELPLKTTL